MRHDGGLNQGYSSEGENVFQISDDFYIGRVYSERFIDWGI